MEKPKKNTNKLNSQNKKTNTTGKTTKNNNSKNNTNKKVENVKKTETTKKETAKKIDNKVVNEPVKIAKDVENKIAKSITEKSTNVDESLGNTMIIKNIVTELYNIDNDIEEKPKKHIIKKIFLLIIIIVTLCVFLFSIYKIIQWKIDSNKIEKQVEEIYDKIKIEEVQDNENTEIIDSIEEEIIEEEYNQYLDYVQLNMINVDFSELKQINNEVVGWIQVNGTNINYPFVQTSNNDYYLKRAFDKSYNEAGWVFLDYRNKNTSVDRNTILYAHGRSDLTMFGSLRFILNNGWLNNTNNFIIKLSTETENTMWQIFSVYHIPVTSDYLQIDFYDNNEFKTLMDKIISRSAYNFNTSVTENDNILTLSTCYNESERMVVHAKLIKREKK